MSDGSGTRDFLNRRLGSQVARINQALARFFPNTRSAVDVANAAKARLSSTRSHLATLAKEGFVISKERGKYALVRPPPESARRAEPPKRHKRTPGVDKIPAIPFHRAFLRFKRMHSVDGHRFVSFRDPESYVYQKESYKERVAHIAQHELEVHTWTRREIGQGHILRRVIAAIEIPKNNLLQWDARFGDSNRVHASLRSALESTRKIAEFENVFFDHFRRRNLGRETFEHLAFLCGRRYELIAYLFFIADWRRYLPIRTRSFDRVFEELELSLRTERQCSWSNYVDFLRAMELVQRGLAAEGVEAPTLLDAHSFCWLLASYGRPRESRSRSSHLNPIRTFRGTLHPRVESAGSSAEPTSVTAIRFDMAAFAETRRLIGEEAEELALLVEKRRLHRAGRRDLAGHVELVSDRPGLGYDILSFERDGSVRHIEVKYIGTGNEFHLTRNEWLQSRRLPNFWFYLVCGHAYDRSPVITLPAELVLETNLNPTQYLVCFDR